MFMNFITSSAVGTVVKDTVVSAAVGALVGGATSALTGGKFSDGAKTGAIAGGIYGAATSSWEQYNNPTPAVPKVGEVSGDAPSGSQPIQGSSGLLADNSPAKESGGFLSGLSSTDKELLGSAIGGGAKGYFAAQQAKDAQKEAARAAALQDQRFYVNSDAGRSWSPRAMVPRVSVGRNA